jgi:hypothetical protein
LDESISSETECRKLKTFLVVALKEPKKLLSLIAEANQQKGILNTASNFLVPIKEKIVY